MRKVKIDFKKIFSTLLSIIIFFSLFNGIKVSAKYVSSSPDANIKLVYFRPTQTSKTSRSIKFCFLGNNPDTVTYKYIILRGKHFTDTASVAGIYNDSRSRIISTHYTYDFSEPVYNTRYLLNFESDNKDEPSISYEDSFLYVVGKTKDGQYGNVYQYSFDMEKMDIKESSESYDAKSGGQKIEVSFENQIVQNYMCDYYSKATLQKVNADGISDQELVESYETDMQKQKILNIIPDNRITDPTYTAYTPLIPNDKDSTKYDFSPAVLRSAVLKQWMQYSNRYYTFNSSTNEVKPGDGYGYDKFDVDYCTTEQFSLDILVAKCKQGSLNYDPEITVMSNSDNKDAYTKKVKTHLSDYDAVVIGTWDCNGYNDNKYKITCDYNSTFLGGFTSLNEAKITSDTSEFYSREKDESGMLMSRKVISSVIYKGDISYDAEKVIANNIDNNKKPLILGHDTLNPDRDRDEWIKSETDAFSLPGKTGYTVYHEGTSQEWNLNKLAKYVGVKLDYGYEYESFKNFTFTEDGVTSTGQYVSAQNYRMLNRYNGSAATKCYGYGYGNAPYYDVNQDTTSSIIQFDSGTPYTTYPYNLGWANKSNPIKISVPATHTVNQISLSSDYIFGRFYNESYPEGNSETRRSYLYNGNFYLNINTDAETPCAFFQTGHSNASATEEEQELWVNVIYNLCNNNERLSTNYFYLEDTVAPVVPKIHGIAEEIGYPDSDDVIIDKTNKTIKGLTITGEDNYQYESFFAIVSTDLDNYSDLTDVRTVRYSSGVKAYQYIINNSKDKLGKENNRWNFSTSITKTTAKDSKEATAFGDLTYSESDIDEDGYIYIHARSVDNAEHVGEETVIPIKVVTNGTVNIQYRIATSSDDSTGELVAKREVTGAIGTDYSYALRELTEDEWNTGTSSDITMIKTPKLYGDINNYTVTNNIPATTKIEMTSKTIIYLYSLSKVNLNVEYYINDTKVDSYKEEHFVGDNYTTSEMSESSWSMLGFNTNYGAYSNYEWS